MNAIKIRDDIYWVGAIDWSMRSFHGYDTQRGSTYNAYLIIDDKITLIDTVKHGFFGDSELARIYYGTLRLGINLKETPEGWLTQKRDTLIATLPPIKLLDLHFIDEARTMPFYEKGSWTETDRKRMYDKAYAVMLKRALSRQNLQLAQQNAQQQMGGLLHSMGAKHVKVVFANP